MSLAEMAATPFSTTYVFPAGFGLATTLHLYVAMYEALVNAKFDIASPCLILIDEWVAYVRQLYGINGLPGGNFDANLTFTQTLTEAAKAVPHVLLVASLSSSEIEIGDEGGKEALKGLRNTFARQESSWRPVSAEEGYEIVRRRLFQPISDPVSTPV
jgi:uncharacterized protein